MEVWFQWYGLSQVLCFAQKMETADLWLQLYILTDYKKILKLFLKTSFLCRQIGLLKPYIMNAGRTRTKLCPALWNPISFWIQLEIQFSSCQTMIDVPSWDGLCAYRPPEVKSSCADPPPQSPPDAQYDSNSWWHHVQRNLV